MIPDMRFRPKTSDTKGKRIFLCTLLLALAIFLVSLLLEAYQGVVQIVALVLITVSLYFYNRYIATEYEYEITTDNDGAPVFVVVAYQGKRTSTMCRIALWDVTEVKRYTPDALKARPQDKEVSIHKFTPSFSPDTVTVISVRSTYEKSELYIESSEEFDSYFLSIVAEAKALRQDVTEDE